MTHDKTFHNQDPARDSSRRSPMPTARYATGERGASRGSANACLSAVPALPIHFSEDSPPPNSSRYKILKRAAASGLMFSNPFTMRISVSELGSRISLHHR
jgi:hypothetical protein